MYSYSGNPATSPKDLVRFLIGDTDSTEWLLQDEEIVYLLSLYNNAALNAAIRAVETIMSKFSRLADESAGSVSVSFSQRSKSYREMLGTLRTRIATDDMTPLAGGISHAQKQTTVANNDRIQPDFSKRMLENPQAAPWTVVPDNTYGNSGGN